MARKGWLLVAEEDAVLEAAESEFVTRPWATVRAEGQDFEDSRVVLLFPPTTSISESRFDKTILHGCARAIYDGALVVCLVPSVEEWRPRAPYSWGDAPDCWNGALQVLGEMSVGITGGFPLQFDFINDADLSIAPALPDVVHSYLSEYPPRAGADTKGQRFAREWWIQNPSWRFAVHGTSEDFAAGIVRVPDGALGVLPCHELAEPNAAMLTSLVQVLDTALSWVLRDEEREGIHTARPIGDLNPPYRTIVAGLVETFRDDPERFVVPAVPAGVRSKLTTLIKHLRSRYGYGGYVESATQAREAGKTIQRDAKGYRLLRLPPE